MGRSTARAGPSQRPSQSQPSQTQNGRSRRGRQQQQQEDSEDEAPEGTQAEEGEDDAMNVDDGKAEVIRKANDLVRLALFTEQRRVPLRRDDINKKVIGQGTRSFNAVFETAQNKLRSAFGMELVELPSRAGIENDAPGDDANETRPNTGMKKKAAPTGLKQYILRSTLDTALVELASRTDDNLAVIERADHAILFPSQANDENDEGEDPEDERASRNYGSILNWSRSDQLGPTGILYVILALILVSGRAVADTELRRHLKSLGLSSSPTMHPIYNSAAATARALTLDAYFTLLMKQGYLSRDEIGGDAALKKKRGGGGAKRVRTQAEDLEEGRQYEWRWGPRAFSEIGEEYVAKFVAEFMVGGDPNEDEDAHDALVDKMYKGVEKAAGGGLTEIK